MQSPKFAIIGAAGYVAPRHMAAIKSVGGDLVAACDPHDSVGILDSYFPGCRYFSNENDFWLFCRRNSVDYVSICSPNYLHYVHCHLAMSAGCDAIVEKPACLGSDQIDLFVDRMYTTHKNVWPILQCRLHQNVIDWKSHALPNGTMHSVKVEYVTPRGAWYDDSWKGDKNRSGGLAFNIAIHLFDLCCYLFGGVIRSDGVVNQHSATGVIELVNARVNWFLSIGQSEKKSRLFVVDGQHIDLTNGFDNLHGRAYKMIMAGESWDIDSTRPAIEICEGLNG